MAQARTDFEAADNVTLAEAIQEGLTVPKLALLFHQRRETVSRRLMESKVNPNGKKWKGGDRYYVHEAATALVKPKDGLEAYIRQMSHHDLPAQLTKEFWAGQRTKQQVELAAGNLWETEKVVAEVGELMKITKMSTLLMMDAVERQTELTERQRQIIKNLCHGMLEDLVKRVEERFKPVPQEGKHVEQEVADDEDL
jgi:hypothetical protein